MKKSESEGLLAKEKGGGAKSPSERPMTKLVIFNDSGQTMLLRLKLKGKTLPALHYIKPLHQKVVNVGTSEVFLKLWDDNILLVQEKEGAKQK